MFHFLLINFFRTKLSNIQAQNVLQKPSQTEKLVSGIIPLALKKQIIVHHKNAAR